MSTLDRSEILAHYRTLRIAAEAEGARGVALEHGAWLMATEREPIEVVTRRIRAMVAHYLTSS